MSFSSALVGRKVAHRKESINFKDGRRKQKVGVVNGGDENSTYVKWDDGTQQSFLNTKFFDLVTFEILCPLDPSFVMSNSKWIGYCSPDAARDISTGPVKSKGTIDFLPH